MPGLRTCVGELRRRRLVLGLVSNAQFFTRELFPALLGQSLEELGFDQDLQCYSYCLGRAKPGLELFEQARAGLELRGIAAANALYVGNDMGKDILPASRLGFRTALFAGDARSLRQGNVTHAAPVAPDLVITGLTQLSDCLEKE